MYCMNWVTNENMFWRLKYCLKYIFTSLKSPPLHPPMCLSRSTPRAFILLPEFHDYLKCREETVIINFRLKKLLFTQQRPIILLWFSHFFLDFNREWDKKITFNPSFTCALRTFEMLAIFLVHKIVYYTMCKHALD